MAGCAGDACRGLTEPLSKRIALCRLLKWTNSLKSLGMKGGCRQVSVVSQRPDKLYKLHICSLHNDFSWPLEIPNFYIQSPEHSGVSCLADWRCFRSLLSPSYLTAVPLPPALLSSPQQLSRLKRDWQGLQRSILAYIPWRGVSS